ncbi:MAG: hypothetical protein U0359_24835 [Byssovorax sp.]
MNSAYLRYFSVPLAMMAMAGSACGGGTSGTGGGGTTSTTTGGDPKCGDGVVQAGEECDNGIENADTAACTSACKNAACGDGLVEADVEECDLGDKNDDKGTCTTKCKSAGCGDGFLQDGEECDDGTKNADDAACTSACKKASCGDSLIEAGVEECDNGVKNSDASACTAKCKNAKCGDSLVQIGVEECDLGPDNADNGECTTMCKNAACGDGFVQSGEECDDGPLNGDSAACTAACKNATCGDGLVEAGVEECDLGAANSDNGLCTSACKNETCGDGLVGPNEQCDLGAMNANDGACTLSCKLPSCGDGFLQAGEQCDQGAMNSNGGACTLQCKNAACGDGFVQVGVEQCDLGAMNANTGACTVACKNAVCGDAFVQAGVEECDLGAMNSNAGACTLQCKNAVCGDGFKGPGEFCDDGNKLNNDACNATCTQPSTSIWNQDYFGEINDVDVLNGVTTDAAGNVYTVGTVPVPGRGLDIVVRRYLSDGTLTWSSVFDGNDHGDDGGYGIARGPNGVLIIVGYETVLNPVPVGKNIWVRSMSVEGGINWTRRYSGALNLDDVGYGVAVNDAGDIYYAAGAQVTANQGKDIYIAKVTGFDGTIVWFDKVNGNGSLDDEGLGVSVGPNGTLTATGYVRSATGMDTWVRKYKDNGGGFNVLWTKIYAGTGNGTDYGSAVATDAAGNIVVAGAETIMNQGQNIWVRKYDTAGNTVWTQTFDGAAHGDDAAYGVAIDAAGNILVGGATTLAGGTTDGWLRRFTSAGNTIWTTTYNGSGNANDSVRGVAYDDNAEIYVCGWQTVSGPEGVDGWVARYAP